MKISDRYSVEINGHIRVWPHCGQPSVNLSIDSAEGILEYTGKSPKIRDRKKKERTLIRAAIPSPVRVMCYVRNQNTETKKQLFDY